MDRTIKVVAAVFFLVVIACLAVFFSGAPAQSGTVAGNSPIYYFYGEGCPHCHNIEPFISNLTQKYPDANIQVLEVWYNQTNQVIYNQVNAAAGLSSPPGVPEVVIGRTVLVGERDIPAKLEGLVQDYLKKKQ